MPVTTKNRGRSATPEPATVGPVPTPPTARRNPVRIAVAITVTCVGALLIGYAFMSLADTTGVVVARASVEAGTTLTSDDLGIANIKTDPQVSAILADQLESLIGQTATVGILEGSVLHPAMVTPDSIPRPGDSLVSLALRPGQFPPLSGGDRVRVVSTAADNDEPPTEAPRFIEATVVDQVLTEEGFTQVNVLVPEDRAGLLATRAATGRVAIVLDNSEASR